MVDFALLTIPPENDGIAVSPEMSTSLPGTKLKENGSKTSEAKFYFTKSKHSTNKLVMKWH